jgi:hypothetical protein
MKAILVYIVVAAFAGVGVMGCADGQWRVGCASILLAFANGLLLIS